MIVKEFWESIGYLEVECYKRAAIIHFKKSKPSAIAGNLSKQEVRRGRTWSGVQGQSELPAKLLRAKLGKIEPKWQIYETEQLVGGLVCPSSSPSCFTTWSHRKGAKTGDCYLHTSHWELPWVNSVQGGTQDLHPISKRSTSLKLREASSTWTLGDTDPSSSNHGTDTKGLVKAAGSTDSMLTQDPAAVLQGQWAPQTKNVPLAHW